MDVDDGLSAVAITIIAVFVPVGICGLILIVGGCFLTKKASQRAVSSVTPLPIDLVAPSKDTE